MHIVDLLKSRPDSVSCVDVCHRLSLSHVNSLQLHTRCFKDPTANAVRACVAMTTMPDPCSGTSNGIPLLIIFADASFLVSPPFSDFISLPDSHIKKSQKRINNRSHICALHTNMNS